jgi:hypothetical protein
MKGEPSLLTTRSPSPSQSNHSTEQLWEIALGQLQLQMTRATFESWVKDTHIVSQNGDMLVVGTKSDFAKDWLENRLYTTVSRTVTNILGRSVTVSFVVDPGNGTSPKPVEVPSEESSDLALEGEAETALTPGQVIAKANYYKGYYERGGTGYSQLAHHTTYFWMPLLGPAFFLWKLLESNDPRSLKSIGPNYWSLPKKYSYTELATRLNRRHGRYIAGDTLECEQSRLARKIGQPLNCEGDCCGSPSYDLLRLKPHPKRQGLICQHWKLGLLETLRQEGLAAVELNPGERKPTIQIWQMLPIITPQQYARLSSQLQSDYDIWLDHYGHLFDIPNRQTWQAILEPSLVPLMPGYDQVQVVDSFDQRRKKQEFLEHAYPNPNFVPGMAHNSSEALDVAECSVSK